MNRFQGEIKYGAIVIFMFVIAVIALIRPTPGFIHTKVTPQSLPHIDSNRSDGIEKNTKPLYLSGIDVSHYQGKVDWAQVVQDDIHFVYLKATDGITYTDPTFHANQKFLIRNTTPYGAYHFFEPNDNGVKQAENFLAQVKVHKNMLPPVLDVEISRNIEKKLLQKRVRQWLETVEAKIGCKPIIYSYSSFYEKYLGDSFQDYHFWLADYAKKPQLPSSIKQWLFWQHSQRGRVDGVQVMVDKNWFKGDKDDLVKTICKLQT